MNRVARRGPRSGLSWLMLTVFVAAIILGLLVWGRARTDRAAVQPILDQMDRDAAAAQAAAVAAAESAKEAVDAAQRSRNGLPGSS